MAVKMLGVISSVSARVDQSANIIKRITLEVQGDISSVQEYMRQPIVVSFEMQQTEFGKDGPTNA